MSSLFLNLDIILSSATLRIDFDTELAVIHDWGLKVAIRGMGERVNITDALGLFFLIIL